MQLKPSPTKETNIFLNALKQNSITIDLQETAPTVILFPQTFERNILGLKNLLSNQLDLFKIYFAHKATKQSLFIHQAKSLGIGIDVSSEGELKSALDSNFIGSEIEATGSKTDSFLAQLILNGVLINADSVQEIQRIIQIKNALSIKNTIRIGIRIGGITDNRRNLKPISSRFGIDSSDFPKLLDLLDGVPDIDLVSIHFHSGRMGADEKKSFMPALVELVKLALERGFPIEELNIGGGYREEIFENSSIWEKYITSVEDTLSNGDSLQTWDGSSYGLARTDRGTLIGRSVALSKGNLTPSESTINALLQSTVSDGQSLSKFLNDLGISLCIEPGYCALNNAGISVFNVVETKKGSQGNNFIVLGGSHYDLSINVREYFPDPYLISKNKSVEQCNAYIVGLLCKEEDVFINRKVCLEKMPLPGDYLCFSNTASYRSDFENMAPHSRIEKPNYLVATVENNSLNIVPQEKYIEQNIPKRTHLKTKSKLEMDQNYAC